LIDFVFGTDYPESKGDAAMQQFIDTNTPRYQLPFEQLPRGFVPFPPRVVEALEALQQKEGRRFGEDYLRQSLERHTLIYYYQDYPVAYRPAEGGVEVLAVGWKEMGPYWTAREGGVKVIQP
jgi:hypothetical protein